MLATQSSLTYSNPVYPHYFADPFVLRVGGEYYAYGTAPPDAAGRHFPILHSLDLAHWRYVGHAVDPIPTGHNYWAPEVAHGPDGRFYLYYSASTTPSDDSHRLRVAIAERPEGPFIDSGRQLFPDYGFSIDAHPFRDPVSGKWFLFFAADFTNDEPYGTGLAAAPLHDDLMTPIGPPRPVIRASCDWHIYERNRDYKGKVWKAWHCVEGPFVLHHNGRYHCLYSGGAWSTENYGIGVAVASHPLGPYTDELAGRGPTVLKGTPNVVVGPGHNSVVLGPDDKTLFIVYHAWDASHTARRMCIDPLYWTPEGHPSCDGPSVGQRTVRFK